MSLARGLDYYTGPIYEAVLTGSGAVPSPLPSAATGGSSERRGRQKQTNGAWQRLMKLLSCEWSGRSVLLSWEGAPMTVIRDPVSGARLSTQACVWQAPTWVPSRAVGAMTTWWACSAARQCPAWASAWASSASSTSWRSASAHSTRQAPTRPQPASANLAPTRHPSPALNACLQADRVTAASNPGSIPDPPRPRGAPLCYMNLFRLPCR